MIVNEKALVRQMKDAYKKQGYTVAVQDDRMMISSGFWLVDMDMDSVPNEVLSLIALHVRAIPENDRGYKVVKGDDGPYVQSKLITDAMSGLEQLDKELGEAKLLNEYIRMKKTSLRFDGSGVWQATESNDIFLINPQYEVLISGDAITYRVGNGIYAEGAVSRAWVLRVAVDGEDAAKVRYLQGRRWVEA